MKKLFKNKYMILGLVLLLAIGTTYSLYVWRNAVEDNTDISVTINETIKITYYKGSDIIGANIKPVFDKDEGIKKDIQTELDKNPIGTPTINFYLDVEELDDELKNASFKWELYRNDTKVGYGNFENANIGDKITLLTNQTVVKSKTTYSLYIWIDANMKNPNTMGDKEFTFKIS